MDLVEPNDIGGSTPPSTDRLDQLEAHYKELQTRVSQLHVRVSALEARQIPTDATQEPPVDNTTVATVSSIKTTSEGLPFDLPMTGPSIQTQNDDDADNSTIVDIDDLLDEAEALGQGRYDDDIGGLINLYAAAASPGKDAEATDDVAQEIRGLLMEPAFQAALMEEPSAGPRASVNVLVSASQETAPAHTYLRETLQAVPGPAT